MKAPPKSRRQRPGLGERALARRIVQAPSAPEGGAGDAKYKAWLKDIARGNAGKALKAHFAAAPPLEPLIAGLAEYSPHVWELANASPERLLRVIEQEPELHLQSLLVNCAEAIRRRTGEEEVMRLLRHMKAEAALLIALADIGGVWSVTEVTRALTALADAAVSSALRYLLADAVKRGKLLPPDPAQPETGCGYFVLAMGKMGAFELNYSSDIDLIVFFDPEAPAIPVDAEPGLTFVRITRALVRLLQDRTADGYVFRVDLRLRPDPASTQIAISTPAALEYYERRGQNWERSALIKARICAGDIAAGERLLKDLSPFIWRKYMDYAALADIHAMKRQIHAYKGHGDIALEGHNVKLGRGGIREIEFFVQTQQLIAGGRHPNLRERGTLTTLHLLADGGWVGPDAKADLEAAYLFLRRIEHRLQMVADEQTHTLPADRPQLERFAQFLGYADAGAFADAFLAHLRKVQEHYSHLFEQVPSALGPSPALSFVDDKKEARETLDHLAAMGFRNPLEVSAIVRGWLAGNYPSLRGEFARAQLAELVPLLLEKIARAENREAALKAFDRFLANLHGATGGRLFSLLKQNPDLLTLVALILGSAPRLADTLAHYPSVMDALTDPTFFGALPSAKTLADELMRSLEQGSSYEDVLDRLRIFGQEQMFLVGARILSRTVSAEQAGEAFSRLADVAIRALHRVVEEEFAKTHGRLANQRIALLALGKLGGREMTAASDLDLIIVYDFDESQPQSDGGRPLYGSQYFARLTQRLISALTAPTNYGALYPVDMRLRPSGRAGPVATRLDSFKAYQENEAWTWEHMALTRARVVSATPGFGEEVETAIAEVLRRRRDARMIAADAFEMRRALAQEKGEGDRWDLKYASGGLTDVEFIAQYLQLIHAADHSDILDTSTARVLEKAARLGLLAVKDAEVLRPATRLYRDLSQVLRLCLAEKFDPAKAGPGLLALIARAADVPEFATLDAHLRETQAAVRESFRRLLGQKDR